LRGSGTEEMHDMFDVKEVGDEIVEKQKLETSCRKKKL
jgi:hypothetical protein